MKYNANKKALIIAYGKFEKSTRGICVIAETLSELNYNIDYYEFPIYLNNKFFWLPYNLHRIGNINQKQYKVLIPYSTKFPKFIKSIFIKLFEWIHSAKLINILKKREYNLIIIESGKQVFLANVIKKYKKESKVIYRQSDPLELGIDEALAKYERKIMKLADLILIVNDKILNYYKRIKYYDNNNNKFILWENGFYIPEFDSVNPYSEKNNILYYGLFNINITIIKKIAEAFKNVKIHIIGPYNKYKNLEKYYTNIKFYGYIEYEKVLNYIKYADLCLIPYKNSERLNYFGITSKIFVFLYFNKIIINYSKKYKIELDCKNIINCSSFKDLYNIINIEINKKQDLNYIIDNKISTLLKIYSKENRKEELIKIMNIKQII